MALKIIGEEYPLTWEQFEEEVQTDIQSVKEIKKRDLTYHSEWIYRGHSNIEWQLLTTLERYLQNELNDDSDSYSAFDY